MAPIKRNKYTNEMKCEVIHEFANGSKRSDIIQKYGISTNTLTNWVKNKNTIIGNHTCISDGVRSVRTGQKKHTNIDHKATRGKAGPRRCIKTNMIGHFEGNYLNTLTSITGDIYLEINIQGKVLATYEEDTSTHSEQVGLPILEDLSDCLIDINKRSLLDTQDITFIQTQTLDNLLGHIHYPRKDLHQDKFLVGTDITVDDSNSPNELSCSQEAMLQDILRRTEDMEELSQ